MTRPGRVTWAMGRLGLCPRARESHWKGLAGDRVKSNMYFEKMLLGPIWKTDWRRQNGYRMASEEVN